MKETVIMTGQVYIKNSINNQLSEYTMAPPTTNAHPVKSWLATMPTSVIKLM